MQQKSKTSESDTHQSNQWKSWTWRSALRARGRKILSGLPGIGLSLLAGGLAIWGARHSQFPAMMIALLLGASCCSFRRSLLLAPGLKLTVRVLTRIGVALLGLQISVATVLQLGGGSLLFLVAATVATIGLTVLAAPLFGQRREFGLLIGGATAICGASAALAISAVLPPSERLNRQLSFTIMAVTLLSTVAMVAYPAGLLALGFGDERAGFVLGASIHDVAQVVGAGYAMSDTAGETAVVVKLFRVMLLFPLVFTLAHVSRRSGGAGAAPRLPFFILAFLAGVVVNTTGVVPVPLVEATTLISQLMLTASVFAVCVLTPFLDVTRGGPAPAAMSVLATLLILCLALAASIYLPSFH
ncbi:MAG: putative sulfate exporter family transporter [Pseudophaeobacter sp.]|uniref:YeiH family protein n=1 Tax=Pseudophaeobacter sp. TaxID=1971739 RepID=UPI0021FABCF6|nr:putative sulfate exporter family transporter [Phaeobacter sp. G2]